jgi:hypothetical protein
VIAIIDVEASSLFNGYPIEIGWARADGKFGAYLLKPEPEWLELNWDPAAETVHGLSQALCAEQGMSAHDAVEAMNLDLADCESFSDAPGTDWRWLALVLEFGGQKVSRSICSNCRPTCCFWRTQSGQRSPLESSGTFPRRPSRHTSIRPPATRPPGWRRSRLAPLSARSSIAVLSTGYSRTGKTGLRPLRHGAVFLGPSNRT